jgi:hypothetical protein
MDRFLEIKITKVVIFLTEQELLRHLPSDLVALGLRRGKGIIRQRKQSEREEAKHNGTGKNRPVG